MPVRSYRELIVWQKAMDFVVAVYQITARFPREEVYGLTSQLRKSAVSVPSNIAEGQGRTSTREFSNFLSIARGSLNEAETQILIAERLTYVNEPSRNELLDKSAEVGRLLNGLMNSLADK
jgi:four helix bundle protein